MNVCPKCQRTFQCSRGSLKTHIKNCGADVAARFWSFVEKGDGCWTWKGAKHRDGYGRFNTKPGMAIAHRHAFVLAKGQIPDGMDVLHTCDNRACCNPAHLWLGTHEENVADMHRKGRYVGHGATNRHAKLTEAQVREILRLKGTMPAVKLGPRYGVKGGAIAAIWRGAAWGYLQQNDIREKR